MTEPYQPPEATLVPSENHEVLKRRRKFWLRAIWISIAGVIIPPMFGLIPTVVRMVGAFRELAKTGESDPEVIAKDISDSLLTVAWGLVISVIAFLVLIGVLIRFFTLPKIGTPSHPSAP